MICKIHRKATRTKTTRYYYYCVLPEVKKVPLRVVALILLFDASAHVAIIDGMLLANWLSSQRNVILVPKAPGPTGLKYISFFILDP